MKKKFLSSLLFAALVGGATSTFTACKDYDDDINSLQSKIDQLEQLKAAKTEVDAAIANLKSQLEQADAQLQAAIEQKADKSALASLEARVVTLESKIATLESARAEIERILAEKADKAYVDGLYATLLTVDGKLAEPLKSLVIDEASALVEAAKLNLQQQIDAINNMTIDAGQSALVDALKALQANIGNYSISELADQMQKNSDNITNILADINLLNVLVKQGLRSLVFQPQAYYWGIEATRLFTLDGVKWNTEGTAWNQFEKSEQKYTGVVDYGYETYNRYSTTAFFKILDFQAVYHMNPSTAVVDAVKGHSVSVISDDKEFLTRAGAPAGLGVRGWKAENGDLTVNLSVDDPAAIKSVNNDEQVTVFASQAHLNDTTITSDYATIVKKAISDVKIYHKVAKRTITEGLQIDPVTGQTITWTNNATGASGTGAVVDHTTANNNKVMNPNLAKYGENGGIPAWDSEITTDGNHNKTRAFTVTELPMSKTLGPVLGTVRQAVDYYPQDTVCWNTEKFDLKELVCVRLWDGAKPIEVDPAELGLKWKFELTALHLLNGEITGPNNDTDSNGNLIDPAKTSESAHSAIDGDYFRPQMVVQADGSQADFGSKQGEQTIGRTPVVRVSLVDEDGNVYDYGYIRILITPEAEKPADEPLIVDYEGNGWTYSWECDYQEFKWSNTWYEVEYDLYQLVGLDRATFVKVYENPAYATDAPVSKPGSNQEFEQYVWDATNGYVPADNDEYLGAVTQVRSLAADGTETSTLVWRIQGGDLYNKVFGKNNRYPATKTYDPVYVVVKYKSKDAKYPDIYVKISTGAIVVTERPRVTISWDALKLNTYWYANNSLVSIAQGTPVADAIEMHNNTITPEKNVNGYAKEFRQEISATMVGNDINFGKLVTGWDVKDDSKDKAFDASKLTADLVFDKQNNDKVYKGNSGASYKISVTDNGKTLSATMIGSASPAQAIARLTTGPVNEQRIVYGGKANPESLINQDWGGSRPTDMEDGYLNQLYAKDLLNYAGHNELSDDAIRAIIGITFTNNCDRELAHNDAVIHVRFLRPIDVAKEKDPIIEDATFSGKNVIKLNDLIKLNDWRENWAPDYWRYYGVRNVYIDGVIPAADMQTNQSVLLRNNPEIMIDQTGKFEQYDKVNPSLEFYLEGDINAGYKLRYENNGSTVTDFHVQIPVTVEYFWGKIKVPVEILVTRTVGNNAPAK